MAWQRSNVTGANYAAPEAPHLVNRRARARGLVTFLCVFGGEEAGGPHTKWHKNEVKCEGPRAHTLTCMRAYAGTRHSPTEYGACPPNATASEVVYSRSCGSRHLTTIPTGNLQRSPETRQLEERLRDKKV